MEAGAWREPGGPPACVAASAQLHMGCTLTTARHRHPRTPSCDAWPPAGRGAAARGAGHRSQQQDQAASHRTQQVRATPACAERAPGRGFACDEQRGPGMQSCRTRELYTCVGPRSSGAPTRQAAASRGARPGVLGRPLPGSPPLPSHHDPAPAPTPVPPVCAAFALSRRGQKVCVEKDEVLEELAVDELRLKQVQVEASFSQPNGGMCQNMLSWARSVTGGRVAGTVLGCLQVGPGGSKPGRASGCRCRLICRPGAPRLTHCERSGRWRPGRAYLLPRHRATLAPAAAVPGQLKLDLWSAPQLVLPPGLQPCPRSRQYRCRPAGAVLRQWQLHAGAGPQLPQGKAPPCPCHGAPWALSSPRQLTASTGHVPPSCLPLCPFPPPPSLPLSPF